MSKEETKSDRRTGLVIWRNVIAALIILSLIVVRQAIIQSTVSNGLDLSYYVSTAERQRTLSQKISKNAFILSSSDPGKASDTIDELYQDLVIWEDSYQYLISKSTADDYSFHFSESTYRELKNLYANQITIRDAVLEIISLYDKGSPESEYLSYLDILRTVERDYLAGMENVVVLIEQDEQVRVFEIQRLELILFFILVAGFLLQIVLVYLPGQKYLSKNFEKIQYLGDHDRLTGLLNQFALNQRFDEEIRTRHKKIPISLILLEITGFSEIKEKHGLLVSDDVLHRTANAINGSLNKSDYAARLTNDEFAIILHATDKAEVESYTKALLYRVSNSNGLAIGSIDSCMGISQYHKPEYMISCLDRAQTALNQAKQEGKNRIVFESSIKERKEGIIKWNDVWCCGNEELNQQHKDMVQLGNDLIRSSLPSGNRSIQGELLQKIETDLINHTVFEEKILREINYPEISAHTIIHEKLMEKLQELMINYEKEQLNAGYVFSFIVDEIILGHIEKEDSKYFPYIGNNNH